MGLLFDFNAGAGLDVLYSNYQDKSAVLFLEPQKNPNIIRKLEDNVVIKSTELGMEIYVDIYEVLNKKRGIVGIVADYHDELLIHLMEQLGYREVNFYDDDVAVAVLNLATLAVSKYEKKDKITYH